MLRRVVLILALTLWQCACTVSQMAAAPRGQTLQVPADLQPGDAITLALKSGPSYSTRYVGPRDGALLTSTAPVPLAQIESIAYEHIGWGRTVLAGTGVIVTGLVILSGIVVYGLKHAFDDGN